MRVDFRPISGGHLSITRSFLGDGEVAALRKDARELYGDGAFSLGGLGGRTTVGSHRANVRRRLCDVCGLFSGGVERATQRGVGDADARERLFDRMADLREALRKKLGRRLSEAMELQYLRYPGLGGFYGRHVDHEKSDDGNVDLKRSVSLLIYLNAPGWDRERDGGVLRAYPKGAAPQEVIPEGGTLVLFDSSSLEHEALPTHAERWALVGWFMEERDGGGKKKQKKKGGKKKRGRDDGGNGTTSASGGTCSSSSGGGGGDSNEAAADSKRAKTIFAPAPGGSRAAKRKQKQRQKKLHEQQLRQAAAASPK